MFMKNAWILLISWFSVPSAPLIARSAGPIVSVCAVPMLLMAATMAPQSIPNCALTGCGAIKRHDQDQHQKRFPMLPNPTC